MLFYKMQGTGNDFIIVDERRESLKFERLYSNTKSDRAEIAKHLCEVFKTDGVMYVLNSQTANAMMRIFNADGSEALMCGNGLRCFGRYVLDDLNCDEIVVETLKANYEVKRVSDFSPYLQGFEILLNNVKAFGHTENAKSLEGHFGTDYTYDYEFFTVSNPHVVTMINQEIPGDSILTEIGSFANGSDSPFIEGVNVNFCTVLVENKLYVRTFERGVGITKSCGTGMTSSVTRYAREQDRFLTWIDVYNDGGLIRCNVEVKEPDAYQVRFVGNASHELSFECEPEALLRLDLEEIKVTIASQEIEKYEQFLNWTKDEIEKI